MPKEQRDPTRKSIITPELSSLPVRQQHLTEALVHSEKISTESKQEKVDYKESRYCYRSMDTINCS